MRYRCPRSKHMMTLEMCRARKIRKVHGCVTCTVPTKIERDLRRSERIQINAATDTTRSRNPLVEIVGLAPQKVVISRGVARNLLEKLQALGL